MENNSSISELSKVVSPKKSNSCDFKAKNVMKTLTLFTQEELKGVRPFKVTYISNKKATIVGKRLFSSLSTDDEE